MCRAGSLPSAAPSWASPLLPVLGGRKYQANSSAYDFKTSTSSAGCKMRMEEPCTSGAARSCGPDPLHLSSVPWEAGSPGTASPSPSCRTQEALSSLAQSWRCSFAFAPCQVKRHVKNGAENEAARRGRMLPRSPLVSPATTAAQGLLQPPPSLSPRSARCKLCRGKKTQPHLLLPFPVSPPSHSPGRRAPSSHPHSDS